MNKTQLAKLVARKHPEYSKLLEHWDFLQATYEGGREWFDANIFKYLKEGDDEFKSRVKRAYRFNHSKEVIDLVNKYIFKNEIIHTKDDMDEAVVKFWNSSTRRGADIDEYMRHLSKLSSVFGRIWVVVDSVNRGDGESIKEADVRIFSYEVTPQNVLDMSFDEEGGLNWILIRESAREDNDPFESSGDTYYRYRLWTKTSSYLVEDKNRTDAKAEAEFAVTSETQHDLGVVPVFPVDHMLSEGIYSSPSMIGDIAYLDRAVANYLSNLDAIIQDQTFSQLAIPAQGLMPGEDSHKKVIEAGTKRIFTYDGEHGSAPFFMSPDPKQAELIITAIKQIINEIYHSVGVAGERTKSDNSMGIDNSSGVAKAYDFERVNSLLAAKSASLERAEYKLVDLVLRMAGKDEKADEFSDSDKNSIVYPTDFDARGLADELDVSAKLELLVVPIELKKFQLKKVVEKLYPYVSEDQRKKLIDSIDEMEDATDALINKLNNSEGSSEESFNLSTEAQAEESGQDTDQQKAKKEA